MNPYHLPAEAAQETLETLSQTMSIKNKKQEPS